MSAPPRPVTAPGRAHETRRHVGRQAAGAALLALLGGPGQAADDAAMWRVHAQEPRAFGQRVGDVVQRRFRIETPPGRRLDLSSLPAVGRRGKSLELRDVRWTAPGWFDPPGHTLLLEYQVFHSPTEVRTLEMPPLKLRFDGGPRTEDLRIDAWPLTLAPLAPVEVSPRTGLGDLRPAAAAPAIDTTPAQARLAVCAALALAGLAYLARVYLVAPWWAARHRPFAQAWQALRQGGGTASAEARQQAYRQLHRALDRTAGEVVFEQGLARFLAAHPRYAPLRAELGEFFARSRAEFFGDPAAGDTDAGRWLRALCRRCRDLERGAA